MCLTIGVHFVGVNLSINNTMVVDRKKLTDHVPDDATLYIFQALSGG